MNAPCDASTQQRTFQKHKRTSPAENVCMLQEDGHALISFQPASHQITGGCWKSCIWFHWLVLQRFTGLTGLFPSKCEGTVSLCCTWASFRLCAQAGKLLKAGITGFVLSEPTLHGGSKISFFSNFHTVFKIGKPKGEKWHWHPLYFIPTAEILCSKNASWWKLAFFFPSAACHI